MYTIFLLFIRLWPPRKFIPLRLFPQRGSSHSFLFVNQKDEWPSKCLAYFSSCFVSSSKASDIFLTNLGVSFCLDNAWTYSATMDPIDAQTQRDENSKLVSGTRMHGSLFFCSMELTAAILPFGAVAQSIIQTFVAGNAKNIAFLELLGQRNLWIFGGCRSSSNMNHTVWVSAKLQTNNNEVPWKRTM